MARLFITTVIESVEEFAQILLQEGPEKLNFGTKRLAVGEQRAWRETSWTSPNWPCYWCLRLDRKIPLSKEDLDSGLPMPVEEHIYCPIFGVVHDTGREAEMVPGLVEYKQGWLLLTDVLFCLGVAGGGLIPRCDFGVWERIRDRQWDAKQIQLRNGGVFYMRYQPQHRILEARVARLCVHGTFEAVVTHDQTLNALRGDAFVDVPCNCGSRHPLILDPEEAWEAIRLISHQIPPDLLQVWGGYVDDRMNNGFSSSHNARQNSPVGPSQTPDGGVVEDQDPGKQ